MSTILGTALAFVAAIVRPSAPLPVVAIPNPTTSAEAQTLLIDEFIFALRERPETFRQGEHTLDDQKAKMRWWTSNGVDYFSLWEVAGCGCSRVRFDEPSDQRRAWAAIEEWRAHPINRRNDAEPYAHEAIRLWKANAASRRARA